MKNPILIVLLLVLFLFMGCVIRNEKDPIDVIDIPSNPNASPETKAVLKFLASLNEDPDKGTIIGQNCGHTADIYNDGYIMSYSRLVEDLHQKTGKWVGLIGVDYEHDRVYKPDEISKANKILIDYWNEGGLITIGFSALNPWIIDETDLENNPGYWADTRTKGLTDEQLKQIDLNKLVNPKEEIHKVWRRKLDRIADGLLELQEAGVVVIFKPIQEQTSDHFWWGYLSHPDDASPYINLYKDLYNYFTNDKGLNNLLWMYSPVGDLYNTKPLFWAYPGDDVVDIVGPTIYNNDSEISSYRLLLNQAKVFVLGEYGPDHMENDGSFDNRISLRRVEKEYSNLAFIHRWHDWHNGGDDYTYMSLIGNKYYKEYMNHSKILTREDLSWKDYLVE